MLHVIQTMSYERTALFSDEFYDFGWFESYQMALQRLGDGVLSLCEIRTY